MGIAAYRQKRYEAADAFLKAAVETSPNYQPAHYYYALNLKRLGRIEESNQQMAIALDLDKQEKAKRTQQPRIQAPDVSPEAAPPQPPRP